MQDLSSMITDAHELVVCSHGAKLFQHTYNKNLILFQMTELPPAFGLQLTRAAVSGSPVVHPLNWVTAQQVKGRQPTVNGRAAFFPSDHCSFHTPDCKSRLG